jgi:hypothetical protein
MESFRAIRGFLGAVRHRVRRVDLLFYSLAAATALTIVALALPLLAAASPGAASALRAVLIVFLGALAIAWTMFAVLRPRRRTAADAQVARLVGARVPPLASDLLSAVELERELSSPRFSNELAVAFAADTARRVGELRAHAMVSDAAMRRAGAWLGGACVAYAMAAAFLPGTLAHGWKRLVAPGARASGAGALAVPEPLVGDLTITLTFPKHTGRASQTIPSSSGDLLAPRGTLVEIDAAALRPAASAAIVIDGQKKPIPMGVKGGRVHGSFLLDAPMTYRFQLTPPRGRAEIEADAHKIEIEQDRAPRVELVAPADDLEVSDRKRIELGYSVEDDYGLTQLELVWQPSGGREERKKIATRPGRTAQGRMVWDLADIALQPGARVAYHLEARDNDDVGGPNVGLSRTFYLRVYSPRDQHQDLVEREQAIFEAMVTLLADRLEAAPGEIDPRRGFAGRTDELAASLAQLVPMLEKDPLAPKKLARDLDGMRGRLDKAGRDEATLTMDLATRAARAPGGVLPRPMLAPLTVSDGKNIAELEKDVLALDDWLARQRIESMLAIADEIRQHRDKLQKLLEEYKRTGSEKLREEIDRELKLIAELEARLQAERSHLGAEVADRYVNSDAMQMDDAGDCMAKVRERVAAGDATGAAAELAKCRDLMDKGQAALEQGLRDLRGDKFSDEEKAYSELMDEIADLEHDERQIARETEDLEDRYKQRAAEAARDKQNPAREKARETLKKIKKELKLLPRDGLTPYGQDEYDAVARRMDDVERMLDEGDVAEALSMARQGKDELGNLLGDLDDDMADGQPWSDKTDESLEHATKVQPLVDELVKELEQSTPRPEDIMSREDRAKLDDLKKRQQALEDKTRKLGQKAQKTAKQLPEKAGDAAQKGLDDAADGMKGAGKRMGDIDPSGAKREADGAADKLGGLRQRMAQSSRPTMVGNGANDDGPVRIPGADEYKPPEEFREQVLDAKRKGKAPDDYKEQVEQYYREITK